MPQAVTHILIPILLVAIFRDFYLRKKDKKQFPLHYVLLAGLGGVLPDIDIVVFWLIGKLDSETFIAIHRTFSHTLYVPAIFLILFFAFKKIKISELGKHKLSLSLIMLMFFFGSLIHIILDAFISPEGVRIFYPLSNLIINPNFVSFLPPELVGIFFATLDGVLLVVYLIYLEWKHKISDFI
ncbi:hypothetical protein CMI45_01810 [Candidatus Pacearchaeota archaeon]|nr:hypothetical protein [Candidatus Pacearchaeota archaeon]|tara:strand:+ start:1171 stop:1719 length:549 start_codon:yes stop_codon:yes gene_type:complete